MTDPRLLGSLVLIERELSRLAAAAERIAQALEQPPSDQEAPHDP